MRILGHLLNIPSGNQASKIGNLWPPNIAELSLPPSGLSGAFGGPIDTPLESKLCFGVTVVNYDDLQITELLVSVVICD